jgi:hypothetical protein
MRCIAIAALLVLAVSELSSLDLNLDPAGPGHDLVLDIASIVLGHGIEFPSLALVDLVMKTSLLFCCRRTRAVA